jgi:TrpR-related protein YerC/YecD
MAKSTDFNNLYDAVLSLTSREDCKIFFEDICTIKELETMSQRLEVAKMLLDGKTFNEIVAATGASTTTISRVNRCLNYGDGGYKAVIEKCK